MATYAELYGEYNNSDLRNKVAVAVAVWAAGVRAENPATTDHDKRLTIATRTLGNEGEEAQRILGAVLAENKAVAIGAITGASDSAIQTAVDGVLDALASDLATAGSP